MTSILKTPSTTPQDSLNLRELFDLLAWSTPGERAETLALMDARVEWQPFPGSPQEAARDSEADVLGFGGAAGGGKTALLLGLAGTQHWKSIIYRRELTQLIEIEDQAHAMWDGSGRFNSTKHRWRLSDGPTIEFGGVEKIEDVKKHHGRAHDLKGFDELTHFTEYQFRYLCAWNRTTRQGQRTRIVGTFNPPTSAEGDWVIDYFGPWLDRRHPRPAAPGELRWFAMLGGVEREVHNGQPFWWRNKEDGTEELIEPKSRTFIPAHVEDNPILMAQGYKSTLQQLPEPLRSLMLKGDFSKAQFDDKWQVIPTEWVVKAQERWKPLDKKERDPLTCVGIDVARGGGDSTCYAPRYGAWFDKVTKVPGKATPDGQTVVRDALAILNGDKAPLKIDAIGIGASPVDIGRMFGIKILPMVAGAKSGATDKTKKLGFFNKRAEWIWKLREALDPESGEDLALPPGGEVRSDLTAPRFSYVARGIKIEPKEDIKDRIGRSPDVGESIINAWGEPGAQAVLSGPIIISGRPRNNPGA